MSSCFRCGKDLPEPQTECEDGCQRSTVPSPRSMGPTDEQIAEAWRRQALKTATVDWSKVNTLEEMRIVLNALFGAPIYFVQGIPEAIKPFLRRQGNEGQGNKPDSADNHSPDNSEGSK